MGDEEHVGGKGLSRPRVVIADQDTYATDPARPRSSLSRILLSPAFMFYPQIIWVVARSGRKASKGRYGDDEWVESSIDILHAVENVGIRVEITGMGTIKKLDGPAVFIGNHMSTLETFVLPCLIQPVRPVAFVVKKSLLTTPVFGHVMRARDPVVVGRVNPREDLRAVLEEGTKKLISGMSMIVFPQSTRSAVFRPEEFNTLGIKLALKAGVPVVPIALKTDAWGTGKVMKDFGPVDTRKKVHFAFGEPLLPTGRGIAEHEKVVKFIQEKLEQWKADEHSE